MDVFQRDMGSKVQFVVVVVVWAVVHERAAAAGKLMLAQRLDEGAPQAFVGATPEHDQRSIEGAPDVHQVAILGAAGEPRVYRKGMGQD